MNAKFYVDVIKDKLLSSNWNYNIDLGGSGPCLAGTIDELVDNQY